MKVVVDRWTMSSQVRTAWTAALALVLVLAAAPAGRGQGQSLPKGFAEKLVDAAKVQTSEKVTYDGSYRKIRYPNGDVPDNIGVCTDVLIRAYRQLGIDLQVKVHEDMKRSFSSYPQKWGLSEPDPNIDHRRVPNLQTFFRRRGAELPVSKDPEIYQPGDLVTWMLPGNRPHIGIVTFQRDNATRRPLIVHNIGQGPQIEDMLFEYPITGRYRYCGR
jgi:uncharacterized protein YijF (DUF1287 family)